MMSVGVLFVLCSAQISALGGFGQVVEGVSLCCSWWMGDYLSTSLIALTVLVVVISLVSSDDDFSSDAMWVNFCACVSLVGFSCFLFFGCSDFFLFFFFFEMSLIPTTVLILSWGYQPERLQAGLQMVIYTVCGSLPLMVLLGMVWWGNGSDSMVLLSMVGTSVVDEYNVLWFLLLIGMLVKVPVFSVHGWLPKAHVEAPLSGSMLLAGVLLKLGIYGICRLVWCLGSPPMSLVYGMMVVSLWGGVVCSFLCLCFHDVKSVIAYSSIAHMALSLGGILSFNHLGWMGGVCMALAHGVCSPCLFGLANYTYMGTGSRSILVCKGMLKSLPALSAMWFIFCAINLGCPPSINFFSECFLFCSIFGFSSLFLIPLFMMCFLAAGYSLFIYASVNHGYQSSSVVSYNGLSLRFLVSMTISLIILFSIFVLLGEGFL
uniref:NADH-ubiquinone oxidoreductase chain 4 n=2 Tax=Hiatula TaxID=2341033 RepID=A0A4P8L0J4_9BIVA|nr:NADH dehydrogenase subunit 4 [Hiatula diphos]YP_009642885.1 NADH dehydrogenase subunit 4 [Hiatula acuta]AEV94280.1 NADH dehydrogenase subunit 4 [Hiatula diphos]QCQ20449.1 NADH dehydrogenase subunit 4 [Hiatula acuta]